MRLKLLTLALLLVLLWGCASPGQSTADTATAAPAPSDTPSPDRTEIPEPLPYVGVGHFLCSDGRVYYTYGYGGEKYTLYLLDGKLSSKSADLESVSLIECGGRLYYMYSGKELRSCGLDGGGVLVHASLPPDSIDSDTGDRLHSSLALKAVTEGYIVYRELHTVRHAAGGVSTVQDTCYRMNIATGETAELPDVDPCLILEGDALLYTSGGRLFSLDLATLETAELGEHDCDLYREQRLVVARDWLYYICDENLCRVPITGGEAERVVRWVGRDMPARLFYDGELLVAVRNTSSDNAHTTLYSVDTETLALTELWSEPTGMSVWGIAADADWYYLHVGSQPSSIMAIPRSA